MGRPRVPCSRRMREGELGGLGTVAGSKLILEDCDAWAYNPMQAWLLDFPTWRIRPSRNLKLCVEAGDLTRSTGRVVQLRPCDNEEPF